jgi:GDPmannose 4,6-dehydratase
MKAFIIGISGQDGAYLSQLLLDKGYEVYGGSRDPEKNSFENLARLNIRDGVTIKSVSVSDFRSVLQTIDDTKPDEIYNLGGQTSVGLSFELPIETFESIAIGTVNILEAIRFLKQPIKFYNACSSECFGDLENSPADETSLFSPRSPYAVAKSAAYWQVSNYREAYDLFACSGILFNHESPLRPERFVTQKIIRAAQRIASGDQKILKLGNINIIRDWGWAPEYVDAMWRMLQQPTPSDYVIGTGESHTLKEFVRIAFEMAELNWKDYVVIEDDLLRPSDLLSSFCNPEKALKQLHWKARYKIKDIIKFMMQDILDPDISRGKP